jgi:catechol 2,3-dioxygenase-like lactoylglutathione lyase family enzyme
MLELPFTAVDHFQMAIPSGGEEMARSFYSSVLGMQEITKPPELAKRGGAWFSSGNVQIHIGSDPDFHPAKKAHPALRCRDYNALLARLQANGYELMDDGAIPGVTRCHIFDPFGNRIELIADSAKEDR